MGFVLCSSFVVICLVSRVSSQAPHKPTEVWSHVHPSNYPNPWEKFVTCNSAEPTGLCDVNRILTEEQRNYFGQMPEFKKENKTDDNEACSSSTLKVTVAIMKDIGPAVSDYRAAAIEFANKFRELWHLQNCSVILIAAKIPKMSFIDADLAVKELLKGNRTEEINLRIYEDFFEKGLFVEGVNETVIQFRNALVTAETTTQTKTPDSSEQNSTAATIIVVVIVCIIVVSIIVIVIVIIKKKTAQKQPVKEEQRLSSPEAV